MSEKKPHPDYIYIDSAALKQRVALHKQSGWLICSDKYPDGNFVSYSPKEIDILFGSGEPITIAAHTVKKIFAGEIMSYERITDSGSTAGGELDIF